MGKDEIPEGCDSFKVWKTDRNGRYMRCACGNTATAKTDEQERLARRQHYAAVRMMTQ